MSQGVALRLTYVAINVFVTVLGYNVVTVGFKGAVTEVVWEILFNNVFLFLVNKALQVWHMT